MHDIKWIRDNPDAFDMAMKRRGLDAVSAELLELDKEKRDQQTKLQELQTERNQKSKMIGAAKAKGEDAESIMKQVAAIKAQMTELEEAQQKDKVAQFLQTLPNIMADDVPDGDDESDNVELRKHGEPTQLEFEAKDHVEIGESLGQMDFETAAKISGARFVLLNDRLAKLERALGAFMLDLHVSEHGYTEVSPPLLVRDNALFGTGQLPKFGEDAFKTTDDYWLIPTAEVSLTNIVADAILSEKELPKRFVAYTPCFRSEAGSAGRDTRGMIRMHQFNKVELVSITTPDAAIDEHERLTGCAEEVLKRLEIPYRVVTLCSGDTGFGAQKTYDLEAWMPAQDTYREISSCSNFGAFQARRMKARFRPDGESKGAEFVHTLNGSGVAVGRAMVAIMENFQNADGSITIPDVLRPYMGGLERISAE